MAIIPIIIKSVKHRDGSWADSNQQHHTAVACISGARAQRWLLWRGDNSVRVAQKQYRRRSRILSSIARSRHRACSKNSRRAAHGANGSAFGVAAHGALNRNGGHNSGGARRACARARHARSDKTLIVHVAATTWRAVYQRSPLARTIAPRRARWHHRAAASSSSHRAQHMAYRARRRRQPVIGDNGDILRRAARHL